MRVAACDRTDRETGTARAYRADIDGLRAIAVLSVMFYHFQVRGFSGGFAGVDVFFVISGFLIAAHIDSDLEQGRFSLLAFYERRIRRILPAFFVMYGLVLLAAWAILIPRDLFPFARMGLRVVPFLANYTFYVNIGGYGGEYPSRIPLLHTWSLAVEEQFYLFFPLLMLLLYRYVERRLVAILTVLCVLSFAACIVAVRAVPSAAFYLTPFRAWELFTGALLAVSGLTPPRRVWLRASIAASGLLLIIAADLFLGYDVPYPSELTLLPVVGAVAIIYASSDPTSVTGRVLGNPLMRRIGWWSYSLYLYHWPVWVLARYYLFDPLSAPLRTLLLASIFPLGWLSWRYVEQPFRRPNVRTRRPIVYAMAAAAGGLLLLGTLALHHVSNPLRASAQQGALLETALQNRCRDTSPDNTQTPTCKLGDTAASADTLLWGDSHALTLLPAFDAVYARHHQALMVAEHGGCPPLLEVHIGGVFPAQSDQVSSWLDALGSNRSDQCYQNTASLLRWASQHQVRTVILAGHWTAYSESRLHLRLTDSQSPHNYSALDNAKVFSRGLERLLAALEHERVRVFVVDDVPESSVDVPYALVSARRLGLHRDFRISRVAYEAQQRSAAEILGRLQGRYGFQVLKPEDYLCAGGACAIARNSVPLYRDPEHLTPAGADVAEPALKAIWNNGDGLDVAKQP